MIKKILPIILCLVLVFGINASAANSTDGTSADAPAVSEEMPMRGGRQGGGGSRNGMRAAPQGENMQNSEIPPAMPNDNMHNGEMTPPQANGAGTENGRPMRPVNDENAADNTTDTTDESSDRMQRGGMGGGMPGRMNGPMQENMQNTETTKTGSANGILGFAKTYSTPITSVILLALAFVFVIFYKRKNY